ncbi:MAG TPA: sulfotransferase [Mycobacteriales bacterium]|nr:sulfotransferase [Mycobacteriales bacterium]
MPQTVLYLAGLGRSGSTLLERMIGELDGVCPAGELVHLWHRGIELDEACGCGKPFSDCRFWTEVGDVAFGGWVNVPVGRVEMLRRQLDRTRRIPAMASRRSKPDFAAELREYTNFYATLYDAIRTVSGASVVIDSSKHPSLAFALAARRDLDLRVVVMVRDPRAVAYSWTKATKRPEAEIHDQAISVFPTYPPARAARLWLGHNASLSLLRRLDVPLLTVRHEDVVADPRATLRRIADWAGLPSDVALPVSADGVAQLRAAHTVSGNPVRFQTGAVPIVADDTWQTALSRRDLAAVTAITMPLLHKFGYPVRIAGR